MFCKIILPNNEIHVIPSIPNTFDELQQLIQHKFQSHLPQHYSLKYKDSDDELVLLVSDDDLKTAAVTIEKEKLKNLRVVVVPEQNPRNGNTKTKTPASSESPDKDQPKRLSSFGKGDISQISMTESITEFPESANPSGARGNNYMSMSQPWEELGIGNEAISQFFSPIPRADMTVSNSRRSFFGKQNSLGNEETEALLRGNEEQLFSSDQMKVIGDIIEKNINKQIVSKLENILSEAVMGFSGNLRSNVNRKGCAYISPLTCTNIPAPFGMRLSTKRCKELVDGNNNICNECKNNIKDIRYNCLTCKDYNCCESCENSVEHPHPLLKIRIPKPDITIESNSASHLPLDKQSGKKINPNHEEHFNRSPRRSYTVLDPIDSGLLDPSKSNKSLPAAHVPKPLESCDVRELLRYKVALVKEPMYDVIRVKANHDYSVEFTIKNAGMNKWTNRVSLLCINGIHKGDEQELPLLAPGQEYVVNLYLTAPPDSGRFLSQWQFHSFDDGAGKPFGKPIYIEIDVSPGSKERQSKVNNEQTKNSHQNTTEKKETRNHKEKTAHEVGVQDKDKKIMKESQCSESVLKRAKLLNDMFPGELKEKIEFVNASQANLSINDLVSAYLDRLSMSSSRKSMGPIKK